MTDKPTITLTEEQWKQLQRLMPPPTAPLPPVIAGWLCPACGSGVAPHVDRCPCQAQPVRITFQPTTKPPSPPFVYISPYDPTWIDDRYRATHKPEGIFAGAEDTVWPNEADFGPFTPNVHACGGIPTEEAFTTTLYASASVAEITAGGASG